MDSKLEKEEVFIQTSSFGDRRCMNERPEGDFG
jgi:hypothetical protein